MLKKLLSYLFILNSCTLLVVTNVTASELKTSSLTLNKSQSVNTLAKPCLQLFKEGDKLISEAEKQPGTHLQVKKMKDKLSSSKQKILKMDSEMQQKSCDKGLIALNNLKQKY